MKKISIILAEILFIVSLFFVSGVVLNDTADAYYNKSRTFSKNYRFDRWRDWMNDRRMISNGTVFMNHYAGMSKGNYTVNMGGEVDFAHWNNITYAANGGGWDTPYGNFCGGINTNCFGNITTKQRVEDAVSSNYAYVHWTAVDPKAYLTSSNPGVISCNKRYDNVGVREWDCTALKPGTSTITITANNAQTRFWGYVRFWWMGAPNWMWLSEHPWGDLNVSSNSGTISNKMSIPGGTVGSWTITVPRTNPTAVIDNPGNSTYIQGEAVTFNGHGVLGSGGGVIDARAWVDVTDTSSASWNGTACNSGHGIYLNGNDSFTTNSLSLGSHRICYNVRQRYVDGVQWWAGGNVEYRDITIAPPPPTDGVCGTANNVAYDYTATGYVPDTQCAIGVPSSDGFPTAGSSISWTCSGINNGNPSPTCSATRDSIPCGTNYSCVQSSTNTRDCVPSDCTPICGAEEICTGTFSQDINACYDNCNNWSPEVNCSGGSCPPTNSDNQCSCQPANQDVTNWIEVPSN